MRKIRGYDRDKPIELLRDWKLFAIACEDGKRTPEYFRLFEYMSDRVKIDIIEDLENKDEKLTNINQLQNMFWKEH